jgi:hypothetical protein
MPDRAQSQPGARAAARPAASGTALSSGASGVGLDNIDLAACSARGIEVIPARARTPSRWPNTWSTRR